MVIVVVRRRGREENLVSLARDPVSSILRGSDHEAHEGHEELRQLHFKGNSLRGYVLESQGEFPLKKGVRIEGLEWAMHFELFVVASS
jgi:hypothetical protein